MTKKRGAPLPERGVAPPPRERAVALPPRERRVAPPPNPRKPQLVRDVHGNELMDLFEFFPDLPRLARRPARIRVRRPRLR